MKLSIKEYMLTKNVSRRTIYNRIEKGQLTTIKDGNKIYITAENMDVNYQVKASASEIKKITENTNKISKLHNKLEEFDYNFLRERLSSIEKSSVLSGSISLVTATFWGCQDGNSISYNPPSRTVMTISS